MITALHGLFYSDDAPATRAFFRDVLRWPYVVDPGSSRPGETDESAWLIFRTGPSDVGVHPTSGEFQGSAYSSPRHHSMSLVCDNLDETMVDMASRGAEFTGEPVQESFGRIVFVKVPGTDDLMLYQPSHPTAYDLPEA